MKKKNHINFKVYLKKLLYGFILFSFFFHEDVVHKMTDQTKVALNKESIKKIREPASISNDRKMKLPIKSQTDKLASTKDTKKFIYDFIFS
jgi:hypothetical protein